MKIRVLKLSKGKLLLDNYDCYTLKEEQQIPKHFNIVKSIYTSICGSDIQKINNTTLDGIILGHECVVLTNDKHYVINPLIHCKKCKFCLKGETNHCLNMKFIGYHYPGGFADSIFIPDENLIEIKNTDNADLNVLYDSYLSTQHGLNLIETSLKKHKFRNNLIIGDGIIGIFLALLLQKKYEIKEITIIGKHLKRFQKISDCLDLNINFITYTNELADYNSTSFDFICEAVGGTNSNSINLASKSVNPKGLVLSYGVFQNEKFYQILLRNIMSKEVNWLGSKSYTYNEFTNFYDNFSLLVNNNTNLRNFIKYIPLNKVEETLANPIDWKDKYLKLAIKLGV